MAEVSAPRHLAKLAKQADTWKLGEKAILLMPVTCFFYETREVERMIFLDNPPKDVTLRAPHVWQVALDTSAYSNLSVALARLLGANSWTKARAGKGSISG